MMTQLDDDRHFLLEAASRLPQKPKHLMSIVNAITEYTGSVAVYRRYNSNYSEEERAFIAQTLMEMHAAFQAREPNRYVASLLPLIENEIHDLMNPAATTRPMRPRTGHSGSPRNQVMRPRGL